MDRDTKLLPKPCPVQDITTELGNIEFRQITPLESGWESEDDGVVFEHDSSLRLREQSNNLFSRSVTLDGRSSDSSSVKDNKVLLISAISLLKSKDCS